MRKDIVSALYWAAIAICLIILGVTIGYAQTPITACGPITAPGSYTITQDLITSGDCLTISAPNVTLNCAAVGGLIGVVSNGTGTAIHVLASATGFTMPDGSCTLSDSLIGIFLDGVSGANINANVLETEFPGDVGIYLLNASHNTITGGAAGFTYGIELQGSNGNLIHNAGASGFGAGIFIWGSSQNNVVYANQLSGDNLDIRISKNSPNNRVLGNQLYPVTAAGTQLFQGTLPNSTSCNGNIWLANTSVDGLAPSVNQDCINQP